LALSAGQVPVSPEILVDFDADEDVLYISLGKPVASYCEEADDCILLRRSEAADAPSGVTALGFLAYWRDRKSEFSELVADFLRVPTAEVRNGIAPLI
jgi:hypothetical protein